MIQRGITSILPDTDRGVAVVVRHVVWLVRMAAFWLAAVLPLLYVPLLALFPTSFSGMVKLFIVNGIALLVGHDHRTTRGSDNASGERVATSTTERDATPETSGAD